MKMKMKDETGNRLEKRMKRGKEVLGNDRSRETKMRRCSVQAAAVQLAGISRRTALPCFAYSNYSVLVKSKGDADDYAGQGLILTGHHDGLPKAEAEYNVCGIYTIGTTCVRSTDIRLEARGLLDGM